MKWKEPKNYKIVKGYVLCSKCFHTTNENGDYNIIPNDGIKGDYEIFRVDKETDDCYYGMPLEGLGLFDCMLPKEFCRPFEEDELKFWQNKKMGMYGSHSGDLSYTYKISINDIMTTKKESWVPKKGDTYYFISEEKYIVTTVFKNDFSDKMRKYFGNCFESYEEAEYILWQKIWFS